MVLSSIMQVNNECRGLKGISNGEIDNKYRLGGGLFRLPGIRARGSTVISGGGDPIGPVTPI